jgi:hypothetical protein
MTPRAADRPFYRRLAEQSLQLRILLQTDRVGVPGQQGAQVFILSASGLLEGDPVEWDEGCQCRGQKHEREQETDRPNCFILHSLKVSLSLLFVNGLPVHGSMLNSVRLGLLSIFLGKQVVATSTLLLRAGLFLEPSFGPLAVTSSGHKE